MIGRTISHYRIIAKLGEGGMGVVYRAEDLSLGRVVALKFLPPHLGADSGARQRFVHEAKAAAALDHPGICTVYEAGEAEGQVFIAMAFLEGETLRERIAKGPLPVPEALEIAAQVADALHEAHGRGVTHRDIKPANVMLTSRGHSKLMDFGLAHVAGASRLTRSGSTVGTVAYMSPEQARGEGADRRTDIWSLGVVLYEMVSGRRPFPGDHEAATLYGILNAEPEPLTGVRTGVPPDLERVVGKCLAKEAGHRYQHADELAVDLRRLAAELASGEGITRPRGIERGAKGRRARLAYAGLALAVVAGVAFLWRPWSAVPVDANTVLVLPFEVRGQEDPDDAAFVGRAFGEAIAVELAAVKDLTVLTPPEENATERRGRRAPMALAVSMRAGQLVTGTLARERDSVRVHVVLRTSPRGVVAWGAQKSGSDRLLPEIAGELVGGILVALGRTRPKLYEYFTEELARDPELTSSPLTWKVLEERSSGGYEARVQACRELVSAFPGKSAALAAYAAELTNLAVSQPTPETGAELASVLERLRAIDPAHPVIESSRALILSWRAGRPAEAVTILSGLLARDDLSNGFRSVILSGLAEVETDLGLSDEAIAHALQSTQLDPSRSEPYMRLSRAYRNAGKPASALGPAAYAIALKPGFYLGHLVLARALSDLHRTREALRHAAVACSLSQDQGPCVEYAIHLWRSGEHDESRTVVLDAERATTSAFGGYNLACYWALAGERERALGWLRKAVEAGYASTYIERDSDLDSLRDDPRFEEIVAELKRRMAQGRD